MDIVEVCEVLITNHLSQIILQLRDDIPGISGPGKWGVIGGRLEDNESPSHGIKREIKEELGLKLETKFLGVIDDKNGQKIYRHYIYQAYFNKDIARINLNEGVKIRFFYLAETSGLDKVEWFDGVYKPILNKLKPCNLYEDHQAKIN